MYVVAQMIRRGEIKLHIFVHVHPAGKTRHSLLVIEAFEMQLSLNSYASCCKPRQMDLNIEEL